MEKASLDFLKDLLNTISPSGYEEEAAQIWTQWTKSFADKIEKDNHGNIIAGINPDGSPRVMLAGHIDEIGFMVTYIDDQGFLSFTPIGGHDIQIVQGMRVDIKTVQGRIRGLIGKKPIHLLDADDRKKVPKYEDLWIDIGAKDGEEARSLVKIGDPVVYSYNFEELRNGLAVARAFDDKIGAFVVAEALRLLAKDRPQAAVFAVATVQEEIGLRGARTSAYHLNPDVGIAIDVTFATDNPGMEGRDKKRFGEIKLGKGPVLSRGANINPKVFAGLVHTAEKAQIPIQVEGAPAGTGTDANAIQLSRAGVATALVSIPNRYMHTPCEVVALSDVEQAAQLLAAYIRTLTPDTSFIPTE